MVACVLPFAHPESPIVKGKLREIADQILKLGIANALFMRWISPLRVFIGALIVFLFAPECRTAPPP